MRISKKTKSLIILTIFAALFICMALIMHLKEWDLAYGVFCNIAATCFTFVILAWVYALTGGEPLEEQMKELKATHPLIETGIRSGLLELANERQYSKTQVNDMWISFLDQEKLSADSVDVISNVGRDIVHSLLSPVHTNSLVNKIIKGCNVRILTLSPKGDAAKIRKEDEGGHALVGAELVPNLQDVIGDILRQIKNREGKGSLKYGFFNVTPSCSIIRIGDRMLVTNYLYNMLGRVCPTFLLQDKTHSGLFAKYVQHFENVWKSGKVLVYQLDEEDQARLYKVDEDGRLEANPTTDDVW